MTDTERDSDDCRTLEEFNEFLDRTNAKLQSIVNDTQSMPFYLYSQAIVRLMGGIISSAIEADDYNQSLVDALNETFADDPSFRWRLVVQN
jgi:hypothetical protein